MTTIYDHAVNSVQVSAVSPTLSDEIERVDYYILSGKGTLKPQSGIYIKVVRYRNGQQECNVCIH